MKKIWILLFLLVFSPITTFSGEMKSDLPVKTILNSGETIQVRINADIKRVAISLRNLLNEESVVFRSERFGGKDRPDAEIGPKQYRTTILNPKIKDETEAVKLDRKTIVLNTDKTDEIYLRVEKGSVEIEIVENKKKI